MANIGNHTFIDGVGDTRLQDGVIRMDLLALSPTQRDKEGNPVPQFVEQLVMSPVAFGRMAQAMSNTIKQAQEKGLIPADGKVEAEAKTEAKPAKASVKKTKPSDGESASLNF